MLPAAVRTNMREDRKSGNRFSESAQTSLVVSQSRLRWGAKHYPMRSSNATSWGPYPGEGPALQRERQRNGISGMGHRLRQRYPRLSSRERPEHSSSHRVRPVSQQSCQGSPTTVKIKRKHSLQNTFSDVTYQSNLYLYDVKPNAKRDAGGYSLPDCSSNTRKSGGFCRGNVRGERASRMARRRGGTAPRPSHTRPRGASP